MLPSTYHYAYAFHVVNNETFLVISFPFLDNRFDSLSKDCAEASWFYFST